MVNEPKLNGFYFYNKDLYEITEIDKSANTCALKLVKTKSIITSTYYLNYFRENSSWREALEHEIPEQYRKNLLQNLIIW